MEKVKIDSINIYRDGDGEVTYIGEVIYIYGTDGWTGILASAILARFHPVRRRSGYIPVHFHHHCLLLLDAILHWERNECYWCTTKRPYCRARISSHLLVAVFIGVNQLSTCQYTLWNRPSITMTSLWARWRLKLSAPRLFTQPFIRV